jgi:hypothetical protein
LINARDARPCRPTTFTFCRGVAAHRSCLPVGQARGEAWLGRHRLRSTLATAEAFAAGEFSPRHVSEAAREPSGQSVLVEDSVAIEP